MHSINPETEREKTLSKYSVDVYFDTTYAIPYLFFFCSAERTLVVPLWILHFACFAIQCVFFYSHWNFYVIFIYSKHFREFKYEHTKKQAALHAWVPRVAPDEKLIVCLPSSQQTVWLWLYSKESWQTFVTHSIFFSWGWLNKYYFSYLSRWTNSFGTFFSSFYCLYEWMNHNKIEKFYTKIQLLPIIACMV